MSVGDSLTDAGGLTRRYFAALGALGWLKLGLVLLFIGGLGVSNQVFSLPAESGTLSEPSQQRAALVAAAGGLVIYLAFRYLAAVLEFVFVESLRSQALSIRHYFGSNLGSGLRLLAFRLGLWLAAVAVVVVPVAWTVLAGNVTDPADVTTTQGVAIGVTAVAALFGLTTITTLTNAFVVPIMLHERRGALSGWRRFVDAMAGNKTGVVGFLLTAWVVGIALWVGLTIIGFLVSFVGIFGLVLAGQAVTGISSAFEPLVVAAVIVGFLGYQYVITTLVAPIRSYVRYLALVVLGDTERQLDLVPAQRAAMQADGDDTTDRDDARTAVDASEPAAGVRSINEPVDDNEPAGVGDHNDPTETDEKD